MNKDEYLQQLLLKLKENLRDNFIGLYLIGSACFGEYIVGKSDLDLICVVNNSLTLTQKNVLEKTLDHKQFACPAKGLDLVIFTEDTMVNSYEEPPFEFWFATGMSWKNEGWETGQNKEMLIFIELCRRHGLTLYGKKPGEFISPVKKQLLLEAFLEMLRWHEKKILDSFHDPKGQNSVLNACRILAFIRENKLLSKSVGGSWFLLLEPDNETVKKVLSLRNTGEEKAISKEEIHLFLLKVILETENSIANR